VAVRADAQQDTVLAAGPWKYSSAVGLTLTESAFSTNWAGGDKGSIVWVLNGDLRAERQFSPRYNISNVFQVSFGQTERQITDPADPTRIAWGTPDKTTDLLAFESTSRWTLNAVVDPYFGLRAETQFSDESSPLGAITLPGMACARAPKIASTT